MSVLWVGDECCGFVGPSSRCLLDLGGAEPPESRGAAGGPAGGAVKGRLLKLLPPFGLNFYADHFLQNQLILGRFTSNFFAHRI